MDCYQVRCVHNICMYTFIFEFMSVYIEFIIRIHIFTYLWVEYIHIYSFISNRRMFHKIGVIITPLWNSSEQTLLKRGQNVNTCRTAVSSDFLHNAKLMGIRERAIKQMRCFSIHSSSIFAPSSTFLVNDAKCFQNITILAGFFT